MSVFNYCCPWCQLSLLLLVSPLSISLSVSMSHVSLSNRHCLLCPFSSDMLMSFAVCVTDSLSVSMSLVDCHSYPQHSLSPSTVIITICITWCLSLSLSMAVSLAVYVSLSDDMSVSVVDSWGCHTWNKWQYIIPTHKTVYIFFQYLAAHYISTVPFSNTRYVECR